MNQKVAAITEHLMNVATKGDQKSISVEELLHKWSRGEVHPSEVINILLQNNAMAEAQVAAIAFTLGITKQRAQEGYVFCSGQPAHLSQETLVDFIDKTGERFFGARVCDVPWDEAEQYKISEGSENGN